jgi:hypothetical protein
MAVAPGVDLEAIVGDNWKVVFVWRVNRWDIEGIFRDSNLLAAILYS